jgi:hypothetical protein
MGYQGETRYMNSVEIHQQLSESSRIGFPLPWENYMAIDKTLKCTFVYGD